MKAYPELTGALQTMLNRMDASLREGGYTGEPIKMYLAGGLAVNYYCGTRYTEDVDASFSTRFILPKNLTVNYRRPDGTDAFIYFDHNYNTSLALLHEDFEVDSREWTGIGNEGRKVELRVFSPIDLAVSKIDRFSPRDREDILALASERLFKVDHLRERAHEAIAHFIGNKRTLLTSIEMACRDIRLASQEAKLIHQLNDLSPEGVIALKHIAATPGFDWALAEEIAREENFEPLLSKLVRDILREPPSEGRKRALPEPD